MSEGHARSRSFDWAGRLWGPPSPGPTNGGGSPHLRGKSSLAQARSGALSARRSDPWAIDPGEIHVIQRADGLPWVLGEGASGSVRLPSFPITVQDLVKTPTLRCITHLINHAPVFSRDLLGCNSSEFLAHSSFEFNWCVCRERANIKRYVCNHHCASKGLCMHVFMYRCTRLRGGCRRWL